jgi:Tfp pilus assembly protein PilN
VAIKVNLLPREARAARAGRAAAPAAPRLTVGGTLITNVLAGVLALVILIMGAMGYRAWAAKRDYQTQISSLKVQNDQLKVQLTELRQAEEAKREIQRRIEVIGKVAKSQGVPLAMLNGVLRAVPQGVWLNTVEMKPTEARVRVETRSMAASSGSEVLGRLEAKRAEVQAQAPAAGAAAPTREVTQLTGYAVVIKGSAFTNFQIADFMDNLRKSGVFADVDFVLTQAERVEQTRVVAFEVTATVKL